MKMYICAALLKLLLFKAYKSTDYDVHQNWKQLTFQLPPSLWYFEASHVGTLDYPPFFAYFEYIQASVQSLFVPSAAMQIGATPSDDFYLLTMRISVIISDLLFYYACAKLTQVLNKKTPFLIALYVNWSLILLDNIHFQYNSMMYGILLLSICYMYQEQYNKSALMFAILLNFKHIFLYSAPAFGIIYLRQCVSLGGITRFCILAGQTIAVTAASFIPIVYTDPLPILKQIGARLFPFQRGLVHDYMAANIWAFWVVLCKVQHKYYHHEGRFKITDFDFYKQITMITTIVFLMPLIASMLFKINKDNFCKYLALVNMIAFNFGYHVHEKAILMVYIPLLIGCVSSEDRQRAHVLGVCGFFSLCPLLPGYFELCIKNMMLVCQMCWIPAWLEDQHQCTKRYLAYCVLGRAVVVVVALVQFAELGIWLFDPNNDTYKYIYETIVSLVCGGVNQVVFADLWVEMLINY